MKQPQKTSKKEMFVQSCIFSGRSMWEPVSQLSRISGSELNSFYSDRNIAITTTLFFIFTFLLSVACYLAVKYRLKSGVSLLEKYLLLCCKNCTFKDSKTSRIQLKALQCDLSYLSGILRDHYHFQPETI